MHGHHLGHSVQAIDADIIETSKLGHGLGHDVQAKDAAIISADNSSN